MRQGIKWEQHDGRPNITVESDHGEILEILRRFDSLCSFKFSIMKCEHLCHPDLEKDLSNTRCLVKKSQGKSGQQGCVPMREAEKQSSSRMSWILSRVCRGQNHPPENLHTLPPSPFLISCSSTLNMCPKEKLFFPSACRREVGVKFKLNPKGRMTPLIHELH